MNWTEQADILRCNPNFQKQRRYDYALVETNNPGDLTVAHLFELLRCRLPDGSTRDVAVVQMLKPSKWNPRTKWMGCRVYDENKSLDFVLAAELIRGVHMIPVFDTSQRSLTYLNDLTDSDIFLRAGN